MNLPADQFRQTWSRITDDNNFTLHGFRRFKTTHLFNLRLLEDEIAGIDHTIYQAGLGLGQEPSSYDRLGLKDSKRDANIPDAKSAITTELVLKLRTLLQQYVMLSLHDPDEALATFGHIMSMETVSLLDDEKSASMRKDLTLHEMSKTRLVRADLSARSRTDPIQRWLHKQLRAFRFWRMSKQQSNLEPFSSPARSNPSYQNTILIANVAGRSVIAVLAGMFLVVPLVVLSAGHVRALHLGIISVSIVVFSVFITAMLKVSNYEMMVVAAAYAAILSVFASNNTA